MQMLTEVTKCERPTLEQAIWDVSATIGRCVTVKGLPNTPEAVEAAFQNILDATPPSPECYDRTVRVRDRAGSMTIWITFRSVGLFLHTHKRVYLKNAEKCIETRACVMERSEAPAARRAA